MATTLSVFLLAAAYFTAGAASLYAQIPMVADDTGVTVNLNGATLLHRSHVVYPANSLAKGTQGTVVVRIRLDANGEVVDDVIVSGPGELAASVEQSVRTWHFNKGAGGSTQAVNIDFAKPTNTTIPLNPNPSDSLPERTTTRIQVNSGPVQPLSPRSGIVDEIDVTGLSEWASDEILAILPVRAGDPFNAEALIQVTDAAHLFDPHLTVRTGGRRPDVNVINIRLRQSGASGDPNDEPTDILLSAEKPTYPPLAKLARQQGVVKLQATVGRAGEVKEVQSLSGPPLLIPAAKQAIQSWVYRPTVLNGTPVETVTIIEVNFTLE